MSKKLLKAILKQLSAKDAEKNKGGQRMIIRIAKLGEDVLEVVVPEDATVELALQKARELKPGFKTEGFKVKISNQEVEMNRPLKDDELITLIPKVTAGVIARML